MVRLFFVEELARGNVSAVARAMGKARMQVQRWLKRFNINPQSFRTSCACAAAGGEADGRSTARRAAPLIRRYFPGC
jgi:hypothetical protein